MCRGPEPGRLCPKLVSVVAKEHLSQPLKWLQQRERFAVTKHNHPIPELVRFRQPDRDRIRAAIEGLKEFQRTHSLEGLTVRPMIEEGRRY